MHKLEAVEEAKRLFEEAKDWGMWRWLTEKGRARRTADAAWAALDDCESQVRGSWSEDFRKAWRELETEAAAAADGRARRAYEKAKTEAADVSEDVKSSARKLKQADEHAYQARMDAEAQFDEADRRLSTDMARDGTQMAIDAWLLREKLIRKMETFRRP